MYPKIQSRKCLSSNLLRGMWGPTIESCEMPTANRRVPQWTCSIQSEMFVIQLCIRKSNHGSVCHPIRCKACRAPQLSPLKSQLPIAGRATIGHPPFNPHQSIACNCGMNPWGNSPSIECAISRGYPPIPRSPSSSSFSLSCPALFSSVSMSVSPSPADTPSLSSLSSILPYFFLSSWANSRSSFSYLTATLETMPHHESLFSICISFRIECYLSKLRPNWRADACSVSLPRKSRGDCRPFRIKGQQAYEIPNRTASHYL